MPQTSDRWTDRPGGVGVGVTPFQADSGATIRLAVAAEGFGYALGAAEGWTSDAVVVLTQIAGQTSRSRCDRSAFSRGVRRNRGERLRGPGRACAA